MKELAEFIQTYGLIAFLVLTITALSYVFKLYLNMADKFNGVIEKIYPTLILLADRLKDLDKSIEERNKLVEWCKKITEYKDKYP